jgi:hypothetical protein
VVQQNIIGCDFVDFDAGMVIHVPIRTEYIGEAECLGNIKPDGSLLHAYSFDVHKFRAQMEDEVSETPLFSLFKK